MAGSGYKNFTTGSVLTASDVQNYLMDQSVMVFAGTASRGSAITSPSEGMVVYLSDTDEVQVYNGTSWSAVGGGAAVLSNTPTGTYSSGGTAYAYYEFTASGTATVTKAGFADVLVVGGGGGTYYSGGGAGGYLEATSVYLGVGAQTVIVGAGGGNQTMGNTSRVGPYYGVGGGNGETALSTGNPGGSGGGGRGAGVAGGAGVSGQGNAGGAGATTAGGGGGGASAAGANATSGAGGAGGAGTASSITGSSVTRAGGGGGGGSTSAGAAGSGGGGAGSTTTGNNATANTGGGAGGGWGTPGASGGSGIVIVRVRTA